MFIVLYELIYWCVQLVFKDSYQSVLYNYIILSLTVNNDNSALLFSKKKVEPRGHVTHLHIYTFCESTDIKNMQSSVLSLDLLINHFRPGKKYSSQ